QSVDENDRQPLAPPIAAGNARRDQHVSMLQPGNHFLALAPALEMHALLQPRRADLRLQRFLIRAIANEVTGKANATFRQPPACFDQERLPFHLMQRADAQDFESLVSAPFEAVWLKDVRIHAAVYDLHLAGVLLSGLG